MTLSRQLLTLMISTFLMIFAGTIWISIDNTRSYLNDQLISQTENASHSLGMSIAPLLAQGDIATAETTVNAMFDSGYYRALKITDLSGKILIERQNSMQIEGVPAWFTGMLTLAAPEVESVITSGWQQQGRLKLSAHPGIAYAKLWQTTSQTLLWSVIALIVALAAAIAMLRAILKPLDAVEHQAEMICNRNFTVVDELPKTRELRRVVEAMNNLSNRIRSSIETLSSRAERMRREAHHDDLTGLMNRRAILSALKHTVEDRERSGSGALLLIRASHFSEYNRNHGFEGGDNLLLAVAQSIEEQSHPFPRSLTARTKGAEFAILLPLATVSDAETCASNCCAALDSLAASFDCDGIGHIGVVPFKHGDTTQEILARADTALAAALHQGPDSYIVSGEQAGAESSIAWEALISRTIKEGDISLLAQPVEKSDGSTLYHELLMHIARDGEPIPAATFAAMADRSGLNLKLDRHMIELAAAALDRSNDNVAVNLSVRSVQDNKFNEWLDGQLGKLGDKATRMLFEISEHALLKQQQNMAELFAIIHKHGARVVIEHFGTRISAFLTLKQMTPDYIKLDGSIVHGISDNSDNRFFLQSVIDIAHGLDIQVIAGYVEQQQDADTLRLLGADALQGYLIGKPESVN